MSCASLEYDKIFHLSLTLILEGYINLTYGASQDENGVSFVVVGLVTGMAA